MSDFWADHEANIIVRNCGCPKHGRVSFWTDHDKKWQARHKADLRRSLDEKDRTVPDKRWRRALASVKDD